MITYVSVRVLVVSFISNRYDIRPFDRTTVKYECVMMRDESTSKSYPVRRERLVG